MKISSFYLKLEDIFFSLRNIKVARLIPYIKKNDVGDFFIRGYLISDVDNVSNLFQKLNSGPSFSFIQRVLFGYIGSRCMFVVEQKKLTGQNEIIGINMYYLNKRDVNDHTIHEGFIGVAPEFRGQGIATKMRKMAVNHFKLAGFTGISTRISLNNLTSLRSAENIGFKPVEKYHDSQTHEDRYYMICKLQVTSE